MDDQTTPPAPPPKLPQVDDDPDEWVEHDDLEATTREIIEGNRQGWDINQDDDEDNGL